MKAFLVLVFLVLSATTGQALAGENRVVVFPFVNMSGDLSLSPWCENLSDSLYRSLAAKQSEMPSVHLVPRDSVLAVLASINANPANPQWETDMWKAASAMNVTKVIVGNFNVQSGRMLINAYVVDVQTRLPDLDNRAKDLFKSKEKAYDAVAQIVRKIMPALVAR